MGQTLTDVAYLKSLLAGANVAPSRQASQNFLICPPVVAETAAAAATGPAAVTELGAGLGVVTQALLENGLTVRAIERDERLAALAESLVPENLRDRLTLVTADLRSVPWEQEEPYQIVGNIPYHLSGLIIRKLTQLAPAPAQIILLIQKEVAERLTAAPPQLTLIGLSVQLWGSAQVLRKVPAGCFWPSPRVDSSLVLLRPAAAEKSLSREARESTLAVARHFFAQRRKQMGGVLKRWRRLDDTAAAALLRDADIASQQRPQEVTPDRWIRLSALINQ
jgi:16S rRNA (adenine1518-N6/adenine1519-N6)-dimethyltransferase